MIQKKIGLSIIFVLAICNANLIMSQEGPASPVLVGAGTYHGLTRPLRDLPVISEMEFRAMETEAGMERNGELRYRSFPYAESALPKGPDPAWQKEMGITRSGRGLVMNFNGQNSPYYPPDANGAVGPMYYMQAINTVYAIYNKTTGAIAAGPTNFNQLFSGVTGSNCNDGDPLILYDEMADRWLAVEFSLCNSNDRVLVAVSQTSDPTGSWHAYSFDVADVPDYEKFGIWPDGYYMATNNFSGKDIYVFERSQMLEGGTAQFVGFDNPWRPTTIDGFMCVPPLDNDGAFAPAGSPGLFITINDDAIAGGSDQLWIYELEVDWANPSGATFNRVQQLNVPAFDSNFGLTWDNIAQPGTNQKLDGIPQVIMNRPQYRNFGAYETIVCCHTVDVDATNHAGIRWYELRRNGGEWSIRQSGTYAPDEHSRWIGAIALNGNNQIGLAYSISSSTVYPGIRFTGQSEVEYAVASGIMDIQEGIIQTAVNAQNGTNRWGDYADLSVDPDNDRTFWFTSQYPGSGGSRMTKIAAFEFAPLGPTALFSVSTDLPCEGGTVNFADASTGSPVSWSWTFEGGEPAASFVQNPAVSYALPGKYDVQLVVSNGTVTDTLLQEDFIYVLTTPPQPAIPAGPTEICMGDDAVGYVTSTAEYAIRYVWAVYPPDAGNIAGNDTVGMLSLNGDYVGTLFIKVQASNDCANGIFSDSLLVNVSPGPVRFDMVPDGGYCEGGQGFEIIIDGSETGITYELFLDEVSTGITLPGYGDTLSFGYYTVPGIYTILAHSQTCSTGMSGSTTVYIQQSAGEATKPDGSVAECNSNSGTPYTTALAANASYYAWALDPAEAGTITGDGITALVDWSPDFYGMVLVQVAGVNDCGAGPLSEGLAVEVINAPHPVITGKDQVCSYTTGKVYSYSTPLSMGNDYFWTVVGGDLVAGQGSANLLVTWTAADEGRITVSESAPNGCTTVADTLHVRIVDCTGIAEQETETVQLYPNPVVNALTVRCHLSHPGTATLHIYNETGQEVMVRDVETDSGKLDLTLPLAGLPAGAYGVKVVSSKGEVLKGKFVKIDG